MKRKFLAGLITSLFLVFLVRINQNVVLAQNKFYCDWREDKEKCIVWRNDCHWNEEDTNCWKVPDNADSICGSFPESTCPNVSSACVQADCDKDDPPSSCDFDEINTAIGCINILSTEGFVGTALKLAITLGGAIAFFLILFGAFQILTSTGNPERIQAGKELITAAIAGLLLIIFAVFILRLIGVEILSLPDF